MAVNRVDFGGNTLIDLTGDTLESAEQLLKGIIAHAKDGSVITGLMEAGGGGVELQYNRLYPAATGTFTPAERTAFEMESPLVIEHNAGIVPFVVMVISNGMAKQNDVEFIASWRFPHWNASYYYMNQLYSVSSRRGSTSSDIVTSHGGMYFSNLKEWDKKNVYVAQPNAMLYVNAGKTYTWTVYGIE